MNVLNTTANLSGKTLLAAENADTIAGLKTFSRGAAPPFAVAALSTLVANLDADKVDGADYVVAAWTPTDGSGAALAFTSVSGIYFKFGRLVVALGNLVFPVTASGLGATIGSLPFACGAVHGGGIISYSDSASPLVMQVTGGSTTAILSTTGGALVPNSAMTGKILRFAAIYLTA